MTAFLYVILCRGCKKAFTFKDQDYKRLMRQVRDGGFREHPIDRHRSEWECPQCRNVLTSGLACDNSGSGEQNGI